MGVVEAFAIGALAGGAGGLSVYLVAARTVKGRTTTTFSLSGGNAAQALHLAQSYFCQRGMRLRAVPDGIAGEEGSEWASGVRVVEVRARDRVGGGVDVAIDVFIRGFYPKEAHVDPKSWFGMIPRRKAFGIAQGLAAAMGAPDAVWQHRRA